MGKDQNKLYAEKDKTFKQFIWDGDKGTCFGRTGLSWCKIGVFYFVFYNCLAVFFGIMMFGFYQTLDTQFLPKYIPGDGSSILRSAAMGFRPLPRAENIESTLIWYARGNENDTTYWTQSLNHFVEEYEQHDNYGHEQKAVQCNDRTNLTFDQYCIFKSNWFDGKCNKHESWGYDNGSPCIILKMNKMIGWVPDVYENVNELHEGIPSSLVKKIKSFSRENGDIPKMVWVSCNGESSADEEYIGQIEYSPWPGFPAYYFPFNNTPGYLAPLVSVQFRPEAHVQVNIECKLWARNIYHSRRNRIGLVNFQILID